MKKMSRGEIVGLLDSMGGPEQIAREGEQFSQNIRFLSSTLPELSGKYPNRWVAVYGGKLVGTSKKLRWLESRLRAKRIDPDKAVIRYLDPDHTRRVVILAAA